MANFPPHTHRNEQPTGVKIGHQELFSFLPITGTAVTPAQAQVFADYVQGIIDLFPYKLGSDGHFDYSTPANHLHHTAADPNMQANYTEGSTPARFMGASMPFIDFDEMGVVGLERMLQMLTELHATFVTAT